MSEKTVSAEEVRIAMRIIAMMDAEAKTTIAPRRIADALAKEGLVTIVREASWGLERVVSFTDKGRRAQRKGKLHMLGMLIALTGLTACGPDGFISIQPSGDAAPDAITGDATPSSDAQDERAPDAGADADADVNTDAACELSGSIECTNVVTAYCARYAACCQQFPGNGKCSVGFDVPATCKAHYTQNGFDCSSGKYAKTVCGSGASCSSSASAASCNAMFLSSGPGESSFATCPAFWGQF